MPLCKGTARHTGQPCQLQSSKGREYCKFHGGHAPIGAANASFKHGLKSKFKLVPGELEARFRAGKDDPERLELREHVDLLNAKLDAVISQHAVAQQSQASATPPWLLLREVWAAFQSSAPGPEQQRAAAKLGAVINAGAEHDQTWAQAVELMGEIRKLVEAQTKRDEKLGQFIPVEKVLILVRSIGASIQRHVPDARARAAIRADLRMLTNVAPSQPLPVIPDLPVPVAPKSIGRLVKEPDPMPPITLNAAVLWVVLGFCFGFGFAVAQLLVNRIAAATASRPK